MKFKEIEFKYRADNVSLKDFEQLCREFGQAQFINASGFDYFYSKPGDTQGFYRHRKGPDCNQLTYKRKTTDKNSYVRTEHNIDLSPGVSVEKMAAFIEESGYVYNFSLYKNAFIYIYDRHTFVYYICYDQDMQEIGRFLEIEMSEEHPWSSEEEAWSSLTELETKFKPLGVTAQSRIKRSLFEMYAKDL